MGSMRKKGIKCSQLWYTPEEYELVKKAANIVRRPMTTFAILATIRFATQVFQESNQGQKNKRAST
jgi:uncharacterized protein (DUF1778 family)